MTRPFFRYRLSSLIVVAAMLLSLSSCGSGTDPVSTGQGGTDQGGTDQGDSDQDDTDQGGTDQGYYGDCPRIFLSSFFRLLREFHAFFGHQLSL